MKARQTALREQESKGERHVSRRWMWCLAALGVALSGCGTSASCKDACNKLHSCNLTLAGPSCEASCASPDDTCAHCLNGTSCTDLALGKCASSCPNTT